MDESLSFDKHCQSRIDKAQAMLGQLNRIGTSNWGISATSWQSIYMGIIRAVAMWGSELGWRGQKRWEKKMIDLQYKSLTKCINSVKGARKELVREIAGVESSKMALDAAQAGLLGKMMRDPITLGDLWSGPGLPIYPAEVEEGTNWERGRS